MSAYRVGLTGGLASGKSTVAHFFAACGAEVADADAIVGGLTAAGGAVLALLRQQLGDWVLAADGTYDRAAVREKIFSQPALRQRLEAVLHPQVRRHMRQQLEVAASPYAIGVVPLLFESGKWAGYFQRIVVVDCEHDLQVERANRRDGRQDAERIIAAQLAAAQRRQQADDIIDNNGDLPQLFAATYRLHQQLLAAASRAPKQSG